MTGKTPEQNVIRVDKPSRHLYWVVALVALVAHTISILATPLWVYPDSIDYIQLAGGIVSHGNWSDELFLIRPPGYPIMLAIVFKLFGDASPVVIQILQHAMGIATAVLTVALSLAVTPRRSVALVAGILCSLSLQVLAYCNMPLTEIPFTLAFIGATYFLVRYWQSPRWTLLVYCSVFAGIAYLIKPIGVLFFGVAATVVCVRVGCELRRDATMRHARFARKVSVFVRRSGAALGVAAAPSLVIAAPWMIQSAYLYSSNGTSRCLDYILYIRPMEFDRLDTSETKSAAMRDIRSVVAEAIERGLLAPDATYRDRMTVINAYKRVRGMPFTESTRLLGRAGLDVMLEHPRSAVINTVKYVAWMMLAPDPVYRFVPGGAPGIEGKRDKAADLYDISTYSVGPGSWEGTLHKHASYLPLSTSGRVATESWKTIKSAFRSRIDRGPSPIGVRSSLYEEFVVLCLLGGVISLVRRRNGAAVILVLLVFCYIGVSAFFSGPQTRYAVVIKPILFVWAGVSVVALVDAAAFVTRRVAARSAHSAGAMGPSARTASDAPLSVR